LDKVIDRETAIRSIICRAEEAMNELPTSQQGDVFPLWHTFVDGAYVREIRMPKGALLTSKIHKVTHPYFILKGKVAVLTEEGEKLIEAPYYGITLAGTKRLLYILEDTVWVTVHVTKERSLNEIEHEIIAKDFNEIGLDVIKSDHKELDKQSILKFLEKFDIKEESCLGLQQQ